MACPPSMPIRHEILPALKWRSTSAALYAIARSTGYRAHSRLMRSICSSAYTAGCGPESIVVTGTYAAQNWPPTAPARSFGMSVISFGWLTAKSTESSPPRSRIASGMSLWPSMRGTVRRMATARARFVSLCAARRRNDGRTESVSSTSTSPHIPLPSFRPSVAFRMCAPWLQFGRKAGAAPPAYQDYGWEPCPTPKRRSRLAERRARRGGLRAAQDAARSAARRPGPHGYEARLRAGGVRHLHGARRRRAGALVPRARPRLRGAPGEDRRRDGRRREAASAAARVRGAGRGAVRLLHTRLPARRRGAARRQSTPHARRHQTGSRGQPLPLHRLHQDLRGGRVGRGTAAGGGRAAGPGSVVWAPVRTRRRKDGRTERGCKATRLVGVGYGWWGKHTARPTPPPRSPARPGSPTTCSCRGCSTPNCCGARIRTRASFASTRPGHWRSPA